MGRKKENKLYPLEIATPVSHNKHGGGVILKRFTAKKRVIENKNPNEDWCKYLVYFRDVDREILVARREIESLTTIGANNAAPKRKWVKKQKVFRPKMIVKHKKLGVGSILKRLEEQKYLKKKHPLCDCSTYLVEFGEQKELCVVPRREIKRFIHSDKVLWDGYDDPRPPIKQDLSGTVVFK